jgi:hypothetical protein
VFLKAAFFLFADINLQTMKKGIFFLSSLCVLTGCAIKKEAVRNASTEKLLTGRWSVEDIALSDQLAKQRDKSIDSIMGVIKNTAYLTFNADHTFLFFSPGPDGGTKGTWKLNPNADILVIDDKGKEST